ncbi:hypothetical protein RZS08_54600, partial [Arthrospira platensis SPKY1]|nr:hypothetical protein [Arthrospira platensis SPKY1]
MYTIIVQDPAGPPGCWQELEVVVPYIPPYTLEVVSVIPPSSPSASDGEVLLTVDANPPLPLDVLVNGIFVGQANSYFFSVTGLSEGVYEIMIVADGG